MRLGKNLTTWEKFSLGKHGGKKWTQNPNFIPMKERRRNKQNTVEAYVLLLSLPKTSIINAWYEEYRKKENAISFIQSKGLYAEFMRGFVK